MATPISPRAALSAAIRLVNVEFARLDPVQQSKVQIVTDDALDAALADDRDQALAEVERWRDAQLAAIEAATR